MNRLRELFDELVDIGLAHSGGVPFLRPPRNAVQVRRELDDRFGSVPEWLYEWFSWHDGSDRDISFGGSRFRPECWAFGADWLRSVEDCARHHPYHQHYPPEQQARAAVFLLEGIQSESFAIDLGFEECLFVVAGGYTGALAPSFEEYLELWLRVIRQAVSVPGHLFPEYHDPNRPRDSVLDGVAANALPWWNHDGLMEPGLRGRFLLDVGFRRRPETSPIFDFELQRFDIAGFRRNFRAAFGDGPS